MGSYRLHFSDDQYGVAKTVEFEAEDHAHALIFAHVQVDKRIAELWQDDCRLCRVEQVSAMSDAHAAEINTVPLSAAH